MNTYAEEHILGNLDLDKTTSWKKGLFWYLIEKAREFQKNIYFCFIDYAKAFDCVDHKKLWEIVQEMGIPDHLTCLLRSAVWEDLLQEATIKIRHETMDWFKTGKTVH